MRIAIDAMGGDHAPGELVRGACMAAAEGIDLVLVGESGRLGEELAALPKRPPGIEVVHASQVVTMEDHPLAVRQKRDSSIRICARLLKEERVQAVVTAGNTGAAMVAAKTVVGTIEGVDRPALAAVFPNHRGKTVVLDIGANVSARPSHLRQFAVMGHVYAQLVNQTDRPRVGLMSVGVEEGKGGEMLRRAFRVLEGTGLNFVGNVEGGDVYSGEADVIVCDGFVGNVLLKSNEALAGYLAALLRRELGSRWLGRLGALIARPAFAAYKRRTDWSEYGAVPLLGVRGGFFIAHGRSRAHAIQSAVRRAAEFCDADLHRRLREKVAELHSREEELLAPLGEDGADSPWDGASRPV
jgi:glycerol-3-phosphate acyltransferase PlsX